jgi:O-methyltransferase
MWLRNPVVQQLGGSVLERFGLAAVSRTQLLALASHKDKDVLALLRKIGRERTSLLTAFEAFSVYSLARAQSGRPGDFAEVGVYQGASSKLLCEVKGNKKLHLFDTFSGLPPGGEHDPHRSNWFACSLESVQEYLQGYEDVHYYKGIFPETAGAINGTEFAFAHFDVDLYESTRACLEFFYPRMISGGIMLSHDYSILAGVRKAFDEFLADKPEALIELPTTQCMVVRI